MKRYWLCLALYFTTLRFHPKQVWETQEMPTALRVCSPYLWLPWAMMQPFFPRAGYDRNTFHTIWHIWGVFTYVVYIQNVYEKPKETCLFAICGNPLVTSQIFKPSWGEVIWGIRCQANIFFMGVVSKVQQIRNKYVFTRLKGMSSVPLLISFRFLFENNIYVYIGFFYVFHVLMKSLKMFSIVIYLKM